MSGGTQEPKMGWQYLISYRVRISGAVGCSYLLTDNLPLGVHSSLLLGWSQLIEGRGPLEKMRANADNRNDMKNRLLLTVLQVTWGIRPAIKANSPPPTLSHLPHSSLTGPIYGVLLAVYSKRHWSCPGHNCYALNL